MALGSRKPKRRHEEWAYETEPLGRRVVLLEECFNASRTYQVECSTIRGFVVCKQDYCFSLGSHVRTHFSHLEQSRASTLGTRRYEPDERHSNSSDQSKHRQ